MHTRTTGFPVAMSGYGFEIRRAPPTLGAHTAEVLGEWLGEARTPAATARQESTRRTSDQPPL